MLGRRTFLVLLLGLAVSAGCGTAAGPTAAPSVPASAPPAVADGAAAGPTAVPPQPVLAASPRMRTRTARVLRIAQTARDASYQATSAGASNVSLRMRS